MIFDAHIIREMSMSYDTTRSLSRQSTLDPLILSQMES